MRKLDLVLVATTADPSVADGDLVMTIVGHCWIVVERKHQQVPRLVGRWGDLLARDDKG